MAMGLPPHSTESLEKFPGKDWLLKLDQKSLPVQEESQLKKKPIQVRETEAIPLKILNFFKKDIHTGKEISKKNQILHAQVYLHEIEQGACLLRNSGQKQAANLLTDFDNQLNPNQRLEILRKQLNQSETVYPQKSESFYKIRHNQWGIFHLYFGIHPIFAFSHMGTEKNCNEDALLALSSQSVIAIADGMGGHTGGEIASSIAIDFFEYAMNHKMDLPEAIALANQAILYRSQSNPSLGGTRPMGCTFASAQIKKNQLISAHLGDAKVLIIRDHHIFWQSEDHTRGQELFREDMIDWQTAYELNHILHRWMGLEPLQACRDVAVHKTNLKKGDRLLMMSDGISDNFYEKNFSLHSLAHLASQGTVLESGKKIIEETFKRMEDPSKNPTYSKSDNLSLALLEYRE